jgi:hypothetical protein
MKCIDKTEFSAVDKYLNRRQIQTKTTATFQTT